MYYIKWGRGVLIKTCRETRKKASISVGALLSKETHQHLWLHFTLIFAYNPFKASIQLQHINCPNQRTSSMLVMVFWGPIYRIESHSTVTVVHSVLNSSFTTCMPLSIMAQYSSWPCTEFGGNPTAWQETVNQGYTIEAQIAGCSISGLLCRHKKEKQKSIAWEQLSNSCCWAGSGEKSSMDRRAAHNH